MGIEELESACNAGQQLDFSRHPFEGPELPLRKLLYPLGFPAEFRTNSPEVLTIAEETWGAFEKKFSTETIQVEVSVVNTDSTECPPPPECQILMPLVVLIADPFNYSIADLPENRTQVLMSSAAIQHELYPRQFLLNSSPLFHVATRFATPVHAGCVALDGHGVLLCGDSGAGKSSLSYACARAGWTFICDDATFLPNHQTGTLATGNCHRVRFRPTAAELFPEVKGLEITPRLAGKLSIEMAMDSMPAVLRSSTTQVDFVVFLNRRAGGEPQLVQYSRDVARYFMRQALYGSKESLAAQYQTIERLMKLDILELRYTDLNWAIARLESLVRDGA